MKISVEPRNITVKLSRSNIQQLTDPYTPPEYSLWKTVTVNGEAVLLNIRVEDDITHYGNED